MSSQYKKVFVTGADGFIGSHLVEKLVRRGYSVKALCLYNSNGKWGWLDHLSNEIKNDLEVVLGDIRDEAFIRKSTKGTDKLFHLAALIAIPYSYINPTGYLETNIRGTLNVLQAALENNISHVIHTSTSETYGTAQFVPITETHPLVGQSPYSASKIAADQMALSFWLSFKTPVTILRPFNTYGPRQSARAVIPTIITQILKGKSKIELGSLSPTRDFNFVDDTTEAFVAVSKSQNTIGEIINSSSNFEISIGQTFELINKIMGKDVLINQDENRFRPLTSEVNRLFGDNTKLKNLTNWEPRFSGLEGFERGLKKTIEWFSNPENLQYYSFHGYSI